MSLWRVNVTSRNTGTSVDLTITGEYKERAEDSAREYARTMLFPGHQTALKGAVAVAGTDPSPGTVQVIKAVQVR